MDDNMKVKVVNRTYSKVGYAIPEMHLVRQFTAREEKTVTFGELFALTSIQGGLPILTDYLVIKDPEVVKELNIHVEPEYWYTEDDLIKLMTTGGLNEFLDCLDFAPDGELEMIKDLAVKLPLNDVAKRKAILDKLHFNVDAAIAIKETEKAEQGNETAGAGSGRRAAVPVVNTDQSKSSSSGRRVIVAQQ